MEKLDMDALEQVSGGVTQPAKRPKYVSAIFCELCGRTIHLSGVYTLERAQKEHYAKVHPGVRPPEVK